MCVDDGGGGGDSGDSGDSGGDDDTLDELEICDYLGDNSATMNLRRRRRLGDDKDAQRQTARHGRLASTERTAVVERKCSERPAGGSPSEADRARPASISSLDRLQPPAESQRAP